MKRLVAAIALLAGLGACIQQGPGHDHHQHGHMGPPAQHGVASLDVYRDGETIHVLTGEQREDAASLWHRSSRDGGLTWSAPVRVDGGSTAPRPMRRGDDAQIVARGDTVLAVWSVPGSGWGGSGPLVSALSRNGGRTWHAAANPSDSGLTTGHGFVDLLADREGLHAVWIDARDKSQGLRYARSTDGLQWTANETVAAGICECCWNSLLSQEKSLDVMFRGKDPRDMTVASRSGGRWMQRGSVGAFKWNIKGCPETGGGLAQTSDRRVHAVVWTGADEKMGLYRLVGSPSLEWGTPTPVGGAGAQHADVAASGSRVAVAWDEGDAIYAAVSVDAGRSYGMPVKLSPPSVRATHPRLVPAGDGFLALWTEAGSDDRWVIGTRRLQ